MSLRALHERDEPTTHKTAPREICLPNRGGD